MARQKVFLLIIALFLSVFARAYVNQSARDSISVIRPYQSSNHYHDKHLGNHSPEPYATRNPDEPIRVLVKVKGQPLAVFSRQEREILAKRSDKPLSPDQRQVLAKSVHGHRQKLLKGQEKLFSLMRQQGLDTTVHKQFFSVSNLISITVRAGDVDIIRQMPGVVTVYPERRHRALLDDSVASLGAPQVWEMRDGEDRALAGQGIRVAILDTGIDYTHPDLGGCVGEHCKVIAGVDVTALSPDGDEAPSTDEKDFRDYNGHGTHVAGIVAADGQVRGVAPESRLYAVKVLNDSGSGGSTSIIAGIEWALDPDGDPTTDDGAHVMNMSLGGGLDEAMLEAVSNATEAGTVVVAAAGNDGVYNSIGSPGSSEKVVTVGAIDKDDNIADFSSRGPVPGDYIKPDLVAPGVDINSTWLNGSYKSSQGTSMAAPHVAGAAALLRQLHPQLSAADIKALLVNHSRGLGLGVFTQGAGAVDLRASAQSQWLFTPSSLMFGRYTPESVSSTQEVSVTVANIGDSAGQIALGSNGPVIAGTQLSIAGDTETLVMPGEQRALAVSLAVDNTALPLAVNESLHHESYASLSFSDETVRLPFALIKSALLKLQMEDTLEFVMLVDKENGGIHYIYDQDCADELEEREFALRPGQYKAVWMFADEPCSATSKMVFAEDFQVDTVSSIQASASQAEYELGVEAVVNKQGQPLNLDRLTLDHSCFNLWHPSMEFLHFYCGARGGNPNKALMTNDIPDDYIFDYALILSGEGSEDQLNHRNLYLLSDKIEDGLSASRKMSLDLNTAGQFNLNVVNPEWNSMSLRAGVSLIKPLGVDGKTGGNFTADISGVYTLPASFTLHGGLSNLDMSEWFAGIKLDQNVDEEIQGAHYFKKSLLITGPVGFADANSYFKFIQGGERLHVIFQSQDNESYVMQPGYYFSGRPTIAPDMNYLNVMGSFFPDYGLQKDETHNRFGSSLPFIVDCDGRTVYEGDFSDSFYADFPTETGCQQVTLSATMDTLFYGVEDSSQITIEFERQPADSFGNAIGLDNLPDWMEAPSLEHLAFTSDGQLTRLLTGDELAVHFRLGSEGNVAAVEHVGLAYRLEGDTGWTPLALQSDGEDFQARLPVINGSRLGSLRLMVEDERGHRMTQTLNSLFYLGREAHAQIELPPVFGAITELTFEALGAVTDISFLSTMALDPYGGSVVATLESDSLLVLGTHELNWKAVGSTGLEAYATQIMHIVDTTPPAITAPAESRVEVVSGDTADNPASPTAQDLVDGAIAPVPDQEGPFAEGEHTITWTATDNSGNVATSMQTLTVSVPAPTSTPSPDNNNSNSGGGGSMGLWWLLWMMLSAAVGRGVLGRTSEV